MGGSQASPNCQLYLVMEVQVATRDHLAAVLARVPVASVLFIPAGGGKLTASTTKPLVDLAQSKNVAALLLDDVALARTLRADGVHLSAGDDVLQRYDSAREMLGSRANIGVDCGGSRHTAMELGEAGADYVAFGRDVPSVPPPLDDETTVADLTGPFDQLGLIDWWSAVVEVPCVAFGVEDAPTAARLAAAGADFVAVTAPAGKPAAAMLEWLTDVAQTLERADA